jgi:hypothetical protein
VRDRDPSGSELVAEKRTVARYDLGSGQ